MARAAFATQEKEKAPGHQVRVRALMRGHDGLVIRNEGEVFFLDCNTLPTMRTGEQIPMDAETKKPRQSVKTPEGTIHLIPRWCVKVGDREKVAPEDEVAKGHKTAFKPGDDDVI